MWGPDRKVRSTSSSEARAARQLAIRNRGRLAFSSTPGGFGVSYVSMWRVTLGRKNATNVEELEKNKENAQNFKKFAMYNMPF